MPGSSYNLSNALIPYKTAISNTISGKGSNERRTKGRITNTKHSKNQQLGKTKCAGRHFNDVILPQICALAVNPNSGARQQNLEAVPQEFLGEPKYKAPCGLVVY